MGLPVILLLILSILSFDTFVFVFVFVFGVYLLLLWIKASNDSKIEEAATNGWTKEVEKIEERKKSQNGFMFQLIQALIMIVVAFIAYMIGNRDVFGTREGQ